MWTFELDPAVWRAMALACFAAASGGLAWLVTSVPPMAPVRTGERGRMRAAWLERGGLAPLWDAIVGRVAGWMPGVLSGPTRARMQRQLVLAGEPWGFGPEQWLAASACSGLCGALMGALLVDVLGIPLALAVALLSPLIPTLRIREQRLARVTAIERSLPIAMDLVALCVRAGSDLPAALKFVVTELRGAHPVCSHELSRVDEALAVGRTRVDALRAFAERIDSAPVARFVASLVQSERRGIALADTLATQAESLRRLRSVRAEESAARAGVRMVLPLMLMLMAILLLLIGPLVLEGLAL